MSPIEDDPFAGELRIIGSGGPVSNLAAWKANAAPAGKDKQWKDLRSAKESGRAWCEPELGPPDALTLLLDTSDLTRGTNFGLVQPEVRLRLDEHAGNTRNTDVLAHGVAGDRRVLVAVEAKADETFGQTIKQAYEENPEGSNRPDRIERLCSLLFDTSEANEIVERLGSLRYQLLHGVAGCLLEAKAKEADVAVFAVHVFTSSATHAHKVDSNARDLAAFLEAMGAAGDPEDQLVEIRAPGASGWSHPAQAFVGGANTKL